jgi:hypothetical protein
VATERSVVMARDEVHDLSCDAAGRDHLMRNDEAVGDEGAATPGSRSDVIREPDNSVVDDWLGQRVARDEDRAEEALTEAGGDEQEAERIFDAASHEGDEYRSQHTQDDS